MSGTYPLDAGAGLDGRTATLARNWWAIALRGVFAIVFGIVALVLPGLTIASLVLLFGVYMAVDGVFAIVSGVRALAHHQRWAVLIAEGILDLAAAAVAFALPILTVAALVTFGAIWAVITGVVMLVAAFRLPIAHGRLLMILGAVISIVWGVLLFVSPIAGAVVLTWWMGGYAIVFGGAMLALAFRVRRAGAISSPAYR